MGYVISHTLYNYGKKKLENSFSLLWFIQIPIRPRTIGMLIRCSFWNFSLSRSAGVVYCLTSSAFLAIAWLVHIWALPVPASPKRTDSDSSTGWTSVHTPGRQRQELNSSFQHYVSTRCYQEFSHTRITPFSRFSPYKVTMSDSIHGLLLLCPCLSSSSLRLHVPSRFFFCFKSLHSNAAQQPGDFFFFSFFPLPLSRFSIWASKGLQGLIWCLSLSPQLVCGLRANCRVWSVCELIKISRSPQCSCPLSLQSTSPRYV